MNRHQRRAHAKTAAKSSPTAWLFSLDTLLLARLSSGEAAPDTTISALRDLVLEAYPAPSLEAAWRLGGDDALLPLVQAALGLTTTRSLLPFRLATPA